MDTHRFTLHKYKYGNITLVMVVLLQMVQVVLNTQLLYTLLLLNQRIISLQALVT